MFGLPYIEKYFPKLGYFLGPKKTHLKNNKNQKKSLAGKLYYFGQRTCLSYFRKECFRTEFKENLSTE